MELIDMKRGINHPFLAFLLLFGVREVLCVDGNPAKLKDYPFFAVVFVEGRPTCSATLYTPSRLITACHCLLKGSPETFGPPQELEDPEKIKVVVGGNGTLITGQARRVKMIDVHPKCESSAKAMVYDYGVIEVTEPFDLSDGHAAVRNILEEKEAITRTIYDPDTDHCVELDFGGVTILWWNIQCN
uniref:Trypsin n=1 Tax=Lygus hesperus TaxID=30085 RepID=A0A0A9XTD6_LYGHE